MYSSILSIPSPPYLQYHVLSSETLPSCLLPASPSSTAPPAWLSPSHKAELEDGYRLTVGWESGAWKEKESCLLGRAGLGGQNSLGLQGLGGLETMSPNPQSVLCVYFSSEPHHLICELKLRRASLIGSQ